MAVNRKILLIPFIVLLTTSFWFISHKFLDSQSFFISSQQPAQDPRIILSFAVIGDPELDLENLNQALTKIKDRQVDFTAIVGDLTQVGTREQLNQVKQELDKSGLIYYVIPGNHDLWFGRKLCQDSNALDCDSAAVYKAYFPDDYFLKDINGIKLVFLNNGDEWLGLGRKQLNWLKDRIVSTIKTRQNISSFPSVFESGNQPINQPTANSLQPTTIFLHIPLYHPSSDYIMGYRSPELKKEAQELLNDICASNINLVFFGHLHHFRQYDYLCSNGKAVTMIVAGSINKQRSWDLPKFLKVDIMSDGNHKIEEVRLED